MKKAEYFLELERLMLGVGGSNGQISNSCLGYKALHGAVEMKEGLCAQARGAAGCFEEAGVVV